LIQVAYAIGVVEPVSIHAQTYGTGVMPDAKLETIVKKLAAAGGAFDLTPRGIIERLNLRRPIYHKTAAYGHFGRNEKEFTWEKTDQVSALKKAAK
jgi:S-adenosylmethionine synthetase